MRSSRYNYIVNDGDSVIFFNGISESFFRVDPTRKNIYQEILNFPDDYSAKFSDFIARMKNQGFIVDNDTDERGLVVNKMQSMRRPDTYYMMILPTYQCNLRCWYCIQDHQDLWMKDETVELIKRRIENRLNDSDIHHLQLSWFGGEPLMCYDIVLDITRFAKERAEKMNKDFSCSITTNSTLLTSDRIDALHEAGVSSYQITIDGDRMTHDGIKVMPDGRSAYDIALSNIAYIAHKSRCVLRFNYTNSNLFPDSIIGDFKERLPEECRENISFFLAKVWQEDEDAIDESKIKSLYSQSNGLGLKTRFSLYGMCYVDWTNFECVYPNGYVGLCDNNPPDENPGRLMPDGTVAWPTKINCGKPAFETESAPCLQCRYHPICGGPCPAKRQRMLEHSGRITCQLQNPEKEMSENIRRICYSIDSLYNN